VLLVVSVTSAFGVYGQTAIAQEDPMDEFRIPGSVEGIGTHFELTDSEYLNIVVDSTESINLALESMPEMVTLNVESNSEAPSTILTLNGFLPSTTYYKYEDDYHNLVEFTTDGNGVYVYTQDLSELHVVFIQPRTSTIYLSDSGWSDPIVGTWDPVTKTGTLTQDLTETIQIDSNGITLDGNGHKVVGSGSGSGVYLSGRSGVTVKNLEIKNFYYGMYVRYSSGNTIADNSISSYSQWHVGIYMRPASNNNLEGNDISGTGTGIYFRSSNGNNVIGNNVSFNYYTGFGIYASSNNNNFVGNTVNSNGIGTYRHYGGFYVWSCYGNNFLNNTVNSNVGWGIRLWACNNNKVIGNTVSSNVGLGIRLDGSSNTRVYNNNFIDNPTQATAYGSGNIFNWALPQGGNYWSDWTTPDENGDGFVDFPYVFSGGQDNYPWTTPNGWENIVPDTTAPTTTATLSGILGENDWYISNVQITLAATDDASGVRHISYQVDGGVWITVEADITTFTVTSQGSHTIQYYAVDVAENQEETKTATFKMDTVAPETYAWPSGVLGNNGWYLSDVCLTIEAWDYGGSGLEKTEYSFDDTDWNTYSIPLTFIDMGTTTVYYRSIDNAGNIEDTKSVTIRIVTTQGIIYLINDLYTQGQIDNAGIVTSLTNPIKNAQELLDKDQVNAAKNILQAFINEVEAQSGKNIDLTAAEELIYFAQNLLENI